MDLADRAGDGAFQDAVGVEVAGDFRQRPVRILELPRRGAGSDAEGRILDEHGHELVGHAVGEVL